MPRSRPAPTRHCVRCLYQIDALSESRCPECGRAFDFTRPGTYRVGPLHGPLVRRLPRPPGWPHRLLLLASLATFLVTLGRFDWWSRTAAISFAMCVLLAIHWIARATIWVPLRLRFGPSNLTWFRFSRGWLVTPVACGILFLSLRYDLPLRTRVALSAPWLNAAAAAVRHRRVSVDPVRIGLFDVEGTARISSGVWFSLGRLQSTNTLYLVQVDHSGMPTDWPKFGYRPAFGAWHLYKIDHFTLASAIIRQPLRNVATAWFDVVRHGPARAASPVGRTNFAAPAALPITPFAARNFSVFVAFGADELWRLPFGGLPFWHVLPPPVHARRTW